MGYPHTVARFGLITPSQALEREEGGEPWPSASFTPTVLEMRPPWPRLATRTRWATRPWLWPWLASLRVARSDETFNSVAFGCIPYRLRGAGMRGSRLHGNDGGLGGEISILWLNLALLAPFTPSGEAGNEATVASFGTTLTPTHCASVALDVATVASLGVARSGETFNSVAFGCISLHSLIVDVGQGAPSSQPSPLKRPLRNCSWRT